MNTQVDAFVESQCARCSGRCLPQAITLRDHGHRSFTRSCWASDGQVRPSRVHVEYLTALAPSFPLPFPARFRPFSSHFSIVSSPFPPILRPVLSIPLPLFFFPLPLNLFSPLSPTPPSFLPSRLVSDRNRRLL